MKGEVSRQTDLFWYVSLGTRMPNRHTLRQIRALVDALGFKSRGKFGYLAFGLNSI